MTADGYILHLFIRSDGKDSWTLRLSQFVIPGKHSATRNPEIPGCRIKSGMTSVRYGVSAKLVDIKKPPSGGLEVLMHY